MKRALEFFRLQLGLGNPRLALKIHQSNGWAEHFCRQNGSVVLRDTGVVVDDSNAAFLSSAGYLMRSLSAHTGAQWKSLPETKFEARVQGICFEVATTEDVFIIGEVFERGVYALAYPRPCVVIDIGANIGVSALFFASKPWVRRVVAFEPLKPTAKLARANFERNQDLQKKITLFEHGLSDEDRTLEVEYSPDWKGNVGRRALPAHLTKGNRWMETISLREASNSLREILESAGAPVMLKMDCEGAEWQILPNLAKSGLLKHIHQIAFEWHDQTPEKLEQLLIDNGFSVVRRTDDGHNRLGVIYATRAG